MHEYVRPPQKNQFFYQFLYIDYMFTGNIQKQQ